MEINIEKCTDKELFLEMIDDAIHSLQLIREQLIQEIYYDELC